MVITSQPSQNGPELWVVALKKRAVMAKRNRAVTRGQGDLLK